MSVSEHAVFACEFAGGGGDKRRSGGRKSSVSVWISASDLPFTQTNNLHKKLQHKYHDTGQHRYLEEAASEPGQYDTDP